MSIERVVLLVAVLFAACDQRPIPFTPTPGEPCGASGVQCRTGGCCDRRTEVCGIEGHACGLGDCCYVGDNGRVFSVKQRDAGR